MVRSTIVVRASDALPLAASVDDEQTEQALQEHKQQAKLIFRRITPNSEPRLSIESGSYSLQCVNFVSARTCLEAERTSVCARVFSYLIADNVVYLTIAEKSYPRKLAFSYLDELSKEFATSYGPKVETVRRPYAFVGFDTFMSKTARLYSDTRTASAASGGSGLDQLNDDLHDVTRIMTKNMEELLWRGDSLDRMSHLSSSLRSESEKYRKAARNINIQAMLRHPNASPMMQQQPQLHPAPSSGVNAQIQPGAITYTTSTSPDGRIIYHPFRLRICRDQSRSCKPLSSFSYQTANGVVSGIQWIPAEATSAMPTGAQPASAEFTASWNRGYSREGEKAMKEWQKDEDKRRRREEKEAAKRVSQWERERRGGDTDRDLRHAREKDARVGRMPRSPSFTTTGANSVPVGPPGAGGPYNSYTNPMADLETRFEGIDIGRRDYDRERERKANVGYGTARSRKGSVNYDNRRKSGVYADGYGAAPSHTTNPGFTPAGFPIDHRPASPYAVPGNYPPPSPSRPAGDFGYAGSGGYPSSPGRPAGDTYQRASSPYQRAASPYQRAASPYQRAASPYQRGASPYQRGASPYHGPSGLPNAYDRSRAPSPVPTPIGPYGAPRSRAPSPVPAAAGPYGPPRSRAASPMPNAMPYNARSRAASPIPGIMPSASPGFPQPTVPGRAPPSPRASPRMAGNSLSYPHEQQRPQQPLLPPDGFSRPPNLAQSYTWFDTMKIQDMDNFFDDMPRMPLVLVPHDVYHEDWIRFMQDLAMAWAGRLPTADPSRRSQKRSSVTAELVDLWDASFFQQRGVEVILFKGHERRSGPSAGTIIDHLPSFDSDSDSSATSSLTGISDLSDDKYGKPGYGPYARPSDVYAPENVEALRRRMQKKSDKRKRRKARERERKYALYITCVPWKEGGPR
ncbi:hypothetical protein EW146_g7248 [Bondarzewia mesenterica]|uniref:Protein transport protein SEC22 n=1 Tax=Bondarzewia mesenterica TaxID=1095465 RepID=A0A4S4LN77_9AGAM|nr:hypothetical protein EW146_g7248 [Bondarzewia mesenterica]